MKRLLPPANAVLDVIAKTITFSGIVPASISHILSIVNVTRGVLYYQPQGGTVYSGIYLSPVLTLNADLTGHLNTDKLEIFYDTGHDVANNSWAQALSITASATATLVNIANSLSGYEVWGLIGHGTGDGYFFIQINGSTKLSGRTRSTLPTVVIRLSQGMVVDTGSTVMLKVTNESGSTADYEATLLGT